MTVPLSEVFFPSVVVCNINQVRKSFFEELGIYDNETFIRQIYYDYIEGKSHHHEKDDSKNADERKIALHEKILKEYLEKINETTEAEQSINWVTHQKCKDMFILSKVRTYTVLSSLKRSYVFKVWKFSNFSVTHILRKINFGEFRTFPTINVASFKIRP